MSYLVTILRTIEGRPDALTEREIRSAVAKRPELSFEDNEVLRNGKCFLVFKNGELLRKNPDVVDLNDMIALANEMGARVRGDEFETYRSADDAAIHHDDMPLVLRVRRDREKRKNRRSKPDYVRSGKVLGFLVLLMLVFHALGWLE
ncbi:MAG: hypothetical protein J5I92_02595 [Thiogranum sp.]|nr:hypothetical protein [Thiogranum sp.]